MKRLIIAVGLFALSSAAVAGTVYIDGKPCFTVGNTMDCGGAFSGQDEAARVQRAETRRLREQSRKLDECLRKTDWPGMPSRSECQSMYGE